MRMPWRAALPLAKPRTEAGAQRKAEPFRRRRTMEKTMRKMKDSGVEWIGEIPEDWEVGKVKQHYKITLGKMLSSKKKSEDETYENYLCAQNVTENGLNFKTLKKMWFSQDEKSNFILNKNDVIIVEGGNVGLCCIYNGEYYPCYIQNALHKVTSYGSFKNKFLFYWMKFVDSTTYIYQITNKSTIAHYTKDKLGNTPIVCLNSTEQQRIADYLDDKCGQLDSCMELTRRSMEKLREYKNSLIAEAVTRGLDPDVPMKDSGIPWIGKIPEDWDIIKLSYGVSSFGSGTTPASENESFYDGNILWVTTSELRENVIYDTKKHISDLALDKFSALKLFHEGSLVVAMYGATIGRMAFLEKKATTNQACCVI